MQITESKAQNREEAGILLARKLGELDLSNTVVIGVPHGGACVAAGVAEHLHLPLEVMMCREINDPSNQQKTIGSVSENEVVMHNQTVDIPQDYLYYQAIRLRNEIRYENDFYYGDESKPNLESRTVILIDDILKSADTLLACIQDIRKQRAMKIIVAVPFVQAEAAKIVRQEADDLVFLRIQQSIDSPTDYYREFPVVKEWEVRNLLNKTRGLVKVSNA